MKTIVQALHSVVKQFFKINYILFMNDIYKIRFQIQKNIQQQEKINN